MTIDLNTPWQVARPEDARDCTPVQLRERIRHYRPTPPAYDDETVEEYIRQGLAVAELARGRASLGFAQSFHETAGLRFTGQVQADQFNFGGLGATNDGAKGGRFPTVRDGWMAFWAHHMNYWWGPFEEWPDWAAMFVPHAYRNKDVLDAGYGGVVTVVGDYTNGHWAWSPQYLRGSYDNGYAYAIRDGANAILALPRGEEEPQMTPPYSNIIRGLIDVRTDLPRRTAPSVSVESGPFEKLPLSQKRGVVFHYNGPPVSKPGSLDAVKSFASYHVSKNWARVGNLPVYGDGLMYHVAIGSNGEKWLCRDLEAVLWHCGVTYWNERALSIQMIIGDGQRVTEAAKQAAFEVVDDWRKATSTARSEVFGHYELSPTSCPGSVQQDIVLPYRNGKDEPMADGHFFGETGHYVGGGFWQFWNERGGLPIFGYPLTDEFDIISNDPGTKGKRVTVQVFERAVFEYHRDNKPPYDILLRRLGADIKDELLSQAVAA